MDLDVAKNVGGKRRGPQFAQIFDARLNKSLKP